MIRFIYNLLFPLGLAVYLPRQLVKMIRRGNYRHKFGQRFAIYDQTTQARLRARPRTWIHAVSVGEVTIALKLADKLKELDSAFACALSTTTTTGFALANNRASDWIEPIYNPLDFWPITRRAFAVIRPTRLVLVEAEIWPNLVAIARKRGLPIALVNARLSSRSERRFRRFHTLIAPMFRNLDLVCVQEPTDVERWSTLGVPRENIQHLGSIKFDPPQRMIDSTAARAALSRFGFAAEARVLFGGSTHAGEEEMLAEAFRQLRAEFADLKLVIAPRHVERTREVRARLEQLGLHVALRSETSPRPQPVDCVLVDTTGELQNWYAIATIVFIGKSLTARGGQNPVEPILAGKPVLFGPHMENFAALAAALLKSDGAIQIENREDLVRETARLLRDANAIARLGQDARATLSAHAGATARTAELLLKLPRRDIDLHARAALR